MPPALALSCTLLLVLTAAPGASAERDRLQTDFQATVAPFLQRHCVDCHGGPSPEGELDLGRYGDLDEVVADHRTWEAIVAELRAERMPPPDHAGQPAPAVRKTIVDWIDAVRRSEAERNAGDPGSVSPRRLSAAEYDRTIRDLTGADIRPTREFPVDPANEAGFDNSGESLAMSPALLQKYFHAARTVADHVVLLPDRLEFADHPVVAETDRDKFSVRRVIAFYQRQPTDYADYFQAAWRYSYRASLGNGDATLREVAEKAGVSAVYLETIYATLTEGEEPVGPIAAVRSLWNELPTPDDGRSPAGLRAACERLRDFVVDLRRQLVPKVDNLTAPKISDGSQSLVLWKNRQMAANRRRYAGGGKEAKPNGLEDGSAAAKSLAVPSDPSAVEAFERGFVRFCSVFPDAFVVSERARVFLDAEQEKHLTGRLLSAGFHNQMGYFRDDGPLSELILDEAGRRELDRLWDEFDLVTAAPMRQHSGFLWYERAESGFMRDEEFDFARAEDQAAWSEPELAKLADLYLAKAERVGASDVALEAIADHFRRTSASVRRVEKLRAAAEPFHLVALQDFAERAYRRPATPEERAGAVAFYRELRERDGLSHEEAVRDTIVRTLLSPHFCYRVDEAVAGEGPVRPLTDFSLASRLSYFLWSSMPDEELLGLAAAGELSSPRTLREQVRRMLQDERAGGLATEFGGAWLDIRRFEEHNAVDRERFPAFDDALRQAMFQEPIRFLEDLVRRDGSILDLLDADHTFVNPVLARHYGMPEPEGGPDAWVRVDDAGRYGRGGLAPMAVFLTKNSPGLRTSPVKRGYWVVRNLLGERIPPPPATVPDLPEDEAKLGDVTLREALARHRADAACAVCHDRFDGIGLAFEAYGPVGERRTVDLGGKPVDASASFPGGVEGAGFDDLRAYLRERRRDEFVENVCRKLLAYALGRSLLPSDDRLIAEMRDKLAAEDHRFGTLVETIVLSSQFRNKRLDAGVSAVSVPAEEPAR